MPEITVTVKCSNDQKYSVTIDTSKTVLEFKNAIAEQSNTAADRQRLIYSGRVLKDNDTLETYKITEGHTVHMVRSQATNNNTSQPSSRTTPPVTASENPPSTTQPGVPPSTLPATNPFSQLGGLGYNQNPYGLPNANPMMIEQILQNPAMMQHMQQMIQDPSFIESMIAMYPNLSHVAPQLRQMLQDPDVLAMMSNPETLRMAAMQSMMGPGPFTGGIPGTTTPTTTTTTNNNNSNPSNTASDPPSTTTNADTTTPVTPANNPFFFNLFNPAATSATGTGTGTGTGTNPQAPIMPLIDPALLFGAFGMPPASGSASSTAPQIPPEERFQVQLQQLNEMGFYDAQKNIRALQVCQGNVNLAIERLLDPSFN